MKCVNYPRRFSGILLLLVCFALSASAQRYVPTKNSTVEYRVYSHKGGNTLFRGLFPEIGGTIFFDPKHPEKASFNVTLKPDAISTGNTQRDKDLRGPLFLDAEKYPVIRLKSASVRADGKVVYILHGDLTIKGVTKPVDVQFTATPVKDGYLFRGSFQLNRFLFNVGDKSDDIDALVTLFVEIRAAKA